MDLNQCSLSSWSTSSARSTLNKSKYNTTSRQQSSGIKSIGRLDDLINGNNNLNKNMLSCFYLVLALISFSCLQTNHLVNGIKLQPEGREKFYWSGEQFVITCQNNNNIKNVKIRWIGPNGVYITEDRSQRIHAESSGPHGHRLVVMNATAGLDDGPYKCTIGSTDDRSPRETNGFNLTIFKTTNFKETSRHLVLPTGQSGTLNCRAEFDPQVSSSSISWIKDQKPIEMFNDSSIQVIEYDPGRQISQLIISPVVREHEGTYTCRAVAVTSQLSKISDFDIELETNYAPTFDSTTQTVWVESSQSLASRSMGANHLNSNSNNNQRQEQHLQHKSIFPNNARRLNKFHFNQRPTTESQQLQQANNSSEEIVRLELRCSCQANPPASIMWTSTQSSMYVLAKGEPAHILEEPQYEVNGHNSTSILVIGYNLDTNWPYRRDTYICSASNKLGKATKSFNIEQGDPPPAFDVGQHKQYNPQTSLFRFTLLGPHFEVDSQQVAEIVPPVDSFRIRAESGSSPPSTIVTSSSSSSSLSSSSSAPTTTTSTGSQGGQSSTESRTSYGRRHLEPSVSWTVNVNSARHSSQQQQVQFPQNVTVNLARLPSGSQRLYLEAHNAVGWSPNATYLGDYYIISGAAPILASSATLSTQIALSLLISLATLTMTTFSSINLNG